MGIEELQAVDIELGGCPRMGLQQVCEVVEQLGFGEVIQPIIEIGADAPDGAGVGVDRLGLQPLELQMLEMALLLGVETGFGWCCHGEVTS